MGIFKKKKRDYGYGYSNTLEKMILEDDAPDDEKEKIKTSQQRNKTQKNDCFQFLFNLGSV